MTLSKRTFGVELEHGNAIGWEGVQRALLSAYPAWGEMVHDDGSGVEVVSPILSGVKGLDEVKTVMSFLEGLGGTMGEEDGLHVHHHAPELLDEKDGEKRTLRLLKSWCNNQRVINTMLPERRNGNPVIGGISFCRQVTPEKYRELRETIKEKGWANSPVSMKVKCSNLPRFNAINIASLAKYETVEIRQHHGTFDFERAAAWIRFGQGLIETCLDRRVPISEYATVEGFLKVVGMDSSDIEILRKVPA